jgi:hypothetical protein
MVTVFIWQNLSECNNYGKICCGDAMKTLYDYTYDQLGELMLSIGEKKYRGQQLFEWLYRKRVTAF